MTMTHAGSIPSVAQRALPPLSAAIPFLIFCSAALGLPIASAERLGLSVGETASCPPPGVL